MPDLQPNGGPLRGLDRVERDVLYLLTGERGDIVPWSLEDLGREIENDEDATLAVAGLHRAGLLHRIGDRFVFASRAALQAIGFTGHVI